MKINITTTKKLVKQYLLNYPHLRDSDERLIASIWKQELINKDINPQAITGYQFLEYFAKGELTNSESIRRSRQKLQEENVHLRGLKYEEKQANSDRIKGQL